MAKRSRSNPKAKPKRCPDAPQTAKAVETALKDKANPEKAEFFPRFFRTGPGEYGEGDKFIGVVVPDQ